MVQQNRLFLGLLLVASVGACGDSRDSGLGGFSDAGGLGPDSGGNECPVVVRDADCDKTQRPIVFVHGTFGSGDNIANVALLFGSNGDCQDRFVAPDYNSLGGNPAAQLDALIDKVRAETGIDQVELMGHSQGARHCYTYLSDPERASKVAHYIHLAGGAQAAPPSGVPTLSIASHGDTLLGAQGVTGAEATVVFEQQDHFAAASSTDTFVAIYRYLRGKEPKYTQIQCGEETVTLEGKAESFADNVPAAGGTIEMFELGESPRERGPAVATLTVAADGSLSPWQAKRGRAYEFRAVDVMGRLIGRQYFPPFTRSDRLIRFLAPSQNPLAANVRNAIVTDDAHTAVIARYRPGAFRRDLGDSLTIDGAEVLNDVVASRDSTTVALFMFDDNKNGATDGGSLAAYATTPFIRGTDVYMRTSPPAYLEMKMNGKLMKIPNWPSVSEGITFIVFP